MSTSVDLSQTDLNGSASAVTTKYLAFSNTSADSKFMGFNTCLVNVSGASANCTARAAFVTVPQGATLTVTCTGYLAWTVSASSGSADFLWSKVYSCAAYANNCAVNTNEDFTLRVGGNLDVYLVVNGTAGSASQFYMTVGLIYPLDNVPYSQAVSLSYMNIYPIQSGNLACNINQIAASSISANSGLLNVRLYDGTNLSSINSSNELLVSGGGGLGGDVNITQIAGVDVVAENGKLVVIPTNV